MKNSKSLPVFYDCWICGAMHPADWNGDCREDGIRYDPDALDATYGRQGWEEVDMLDLPGYADQFEAGPADLRRSLK